MAMPSPYSAFKSECHAWVFARTESPQRPTSFQVWDGMWLMWLAPGIKSPRHSAQGSASSGLSLDSVEWT